MASLAQHIAQSLASYKRPSRIFAIQNLPLTPTGKVDKRALAADTETLERAA
jgi:non-ribosomal peptide synthetase component E (peptide arylation enzyme)